MSGERLKPFELFAGLDEEDRDALARLVRERPMQAGEVVFREGSESDGLVLLASGRIKLRSRRMHGVVGTVEAPAQLGVAALVAPGPREVTAVAEGVGSLLTLARADFERLVDDAPETGCRLACAIAAELAGLVRESADPLARAGLD